MNPLIAIFITSACVLCVSALIFDPINENISGFKLTQYNLGINNLSYWLSFYISHWVLHFLIDILLNFDAD